MIPIWSMMNRRPLPANADTMPIGEVSPSATTRAPTSKGEASSLPDCWGGVRPEQASRIPGGQLSPRAQARTLLRQPRRARKGSSLVSLLLSAVRSEWMRGDQHRRDSGFIDGARYDVRAVATHLLTGALPPRVGADRTGEPADSAEKGRAA